MRPVGDIRISKVIVGDFSSGFAGGTGVIKPEMDVTLAGNARGILLIIDDLVIFDGEEYWYFIAINSLTFGRRNDGKSWACSRALSEDCSCRN